MNFLLASSNTHKAEEMSELFANSSVDIQAAPEKLEVIEDGTTYEENAFKKAKAYFEKFQVPVVSDDSGLNVESLPGELGIYSARFGGEGLTDQDRTNLLLKKLEGQESRNASFSCVLCFYVSHDEVYFFEGEVKGLIDSEVRGDQGFGYDPVFIPEKHEGNETFAMLPEWKKEHGHRARACQYAIKFFDGKR